MPRSQTTFAEGWLCDLAGDGFDRRLVSLPTLQEGTPMNTKQEPVPKEFYDLVDRFIGLANEMTSTHAISRVSSVIIYAAARYNAHCMLALDRDAIQNRLGPGRAARVAQVCP
jgi:hypothetical protein